MRILFSSEAACVGLNPIRELNADGGGRSNRPGGLALAKRGHTNTIATPLRCHASGITKAGLDARSTPPRSAHALGRKGRRIGPQKDAGF